MYIWYIIEHRLQLLNVDDLVNEAIEAHKAGEVMEVVEVKYKNIHFYMYMYKCSWFMLAFYHYIHPFTHPFLVE